MFAGQVNIVSHSSCSTSAILKYFCPLRTNGLMVPLCAEREGLTWAWKVLNTKVFLEKSWKIESAFESWVRCGA